MGFGDRPSYAPPPNRHTSQHAQQSFFLTCFFRQQRLFPCPNFEKYKSKMCIQKRTLNGERAIFLGILLGLVAAPLSELSDPTGDREYGDSGLLPPLLEDASDLNRNRFLVGLMGELLGSAVPVVTLVTFSLIECPLPLLTLSAPNSSALRSVE